VHATALGIGVYRLFHYSYNLQPATSLPPPVFLLFKSKPWTGERVAFIWWEILKFLLVTYYYCCYEKTLYWHKKLYAVTGLNLLNFSPSQIIRGGENGRESSISDKNYCCQN